MTAIEVVRGTLHTFTYTGQSDEGDLIDPTTLVVDILDPLGNVIVSNAAPTGHPSVGQYEYAYTPDAAAMLGVWTIRWEATYLTVTLAPLTEEFDVVTLQSVDQPCEPWPIDESCIIFPDEATAELIATKQMEASILLWGASGRRIGLCYETIRPCLDSCTGGTVGPYKDAAGNWRNSGCGCLGSCACTSLSRVWLPGPVVEIFSVQVDTDTLVEGADWVLTIEDGLTYLVRTNGDLWPSCSNPDLPCGTEGAFCVTYKRGLPIDQVAISAVSELTNELVRACIPGCPCRLPRNMQQMTRQGVTIAFDTSQTWLRALPSVALFLDMRNPRGYTREPATIWSPDLPSVRR